MQTEFDKAKEWSKQNKMIIHMNKILPCSFGQKKNNNTQISSILLVESVSKQKPLGPTLLKSHLVFSYKLFMLSHRIKISLLGQLT